MSVQRMAQVNELLRKRFAEALEREVEIPRGVIATCKRVITSRDFSSAKIWLSVLPVERTAEVFDLLQKELPRLRHIIAGMVEFQFMPKLRLVVDESEERAQKVTDILDRLQKPDGA